MYITKIKKLQGDSYKLHQTVSELTDNQKRLFQYHDGITTIYSEKEINCDSNFIDVTKFKENDIIAFNIKLNPSKRDIKTKKKIAISKQLTNDWIKNKFMDNGMEILSMDIEFLGLEKSIKNYEIISLNSVFVIGYLKIVNLDTFIMSLVDGIGSSKGFGFGLLNLY
jgi:hypothetical protein